MKRTEVTSSGPGTAESLPGLGSGLGVRRSRYLALLISLLVSLLFAGIAGSWMLYRSVRQELDRQLGNRLVSIAVTAAEAIGPERLARLRGAGTLSPEGDRLRVDLQRMAAANDLQNVLLIDTDRSVLLDLSGRYVSEGADPLLLVQPELGATLLSGEPRTTRLVSVKGLPGEYLKTGYAAMEDPGGTVVGAIAVEGGSDFFSVLPGMRRRLLYGAGLAMTAIFILLLLILRVLRSLMRHEESLQRAAALAAMGQISALVAHELNNPLAIIRSRSERVRAKIEAGKDMQEVLQWFDVIPAEIDRLGSILSGYLALARPEAEAGGTCRVGQVAAEIAALLKPELEKRRIDLVTEFEGADEQSVGMGARSLKQVLLNLILNALQAMDSGGRLVLRARRERTRDVIEVEDSGHGMSEEELRRAHEPFFTTKPTGSGLGLTLVRSLVQARGGSVHLRSRPGRGTRVQIRLPIPGPDRV